MADSFDFLAPGDGSDVSRGGKGDDGSVSPADALIVINRLGDVDVSGAEEFAALSDDGASSDEDHIDPVLLVIQNQDFWGE